MKILIDIEFTINLILMAIFYMHMFQLNSYFANRYGNWMKKNVKKVVIPLGLAIASTILVIFNNKITDIIAIIVLGIAIFYNFPKEKAKVSLKYTSRVKRMLVTEAILAIIIALIGVKLNVLAIFLGIVNILASLLCIAANFINSPIEKGIRRYYINDAKRILKSMPDLTVIGITGSYGKTSTKNFLGKTLSAKYETLITPKNYNTTMGVVKTIREELKPTHKIFVCEMGAAKPNDIKEICDIVNPKFGIITSIGPQHLQTFKSIDNIIKTKFELYDAVKKNGGVTFLNYDNDYIANKEKDGNFLTYGVNKENVDYNAYNIKASSDGLSFTIKDKKQDKEIEFKTRLIGRHNAENLTAAIAVANYFDIPMESVVSRVAEIQSVEHRLQLIKNGNIDIIDDAYNSNPVSSKSAIDTLAEFEGKKIIVTPGLIELGADEEKYNFEFGEYMTNVCDYIFLVNSTPAKFVLEGIESKNYERSKIYTVNSPQEAVQKIASMGLGKVTVLLENDLPDNYKV